MASGSSSASFMTWPGDGIHRRTSAQAQKMESIGQLSGGIAHDFNNLLTVIIGNAEALGRRIGGHAELQQLCDAIFAAGELCSELTRHLLAFSRRQVLQPVAIDCGDLLKDMQRLLQTHAARRYRTYHGCAGWRRVGAGGPGAAPDPLSSISRSTRKMPCRAAES